MSLRVLYSLVYVVTAVFLLNGCAAEEQTINVSSGDADGLQATWGGNPGGLQVLVCDGDRNCALEFFDPNASGVCRSDVDRDGEVTFHDLQLWDELFDQYPDMVCYVDSCQVPACTNDSCPEINCEGAICPLDINLNGVIELEDRAIISVLVPDDQTCFAE